MEGFTVYFVIYFALAAGFTGCSDHAGTLSRGFKLHVTALHLLTF